MKLNLQCFAAEDGGSAVTEISSEQFADMMENGMPADDGGNDDPTIDAPADGDDDTANHGSDDTAGGDGEPAGGDNQNQQQDFKNQFNAQMAAQRRRQEEAQRAQQRVDAVYQKMFAGQINPFTGRPINTEADYLEYEKAFEESERTEKLKEAGLDESAINDMVSNDPRVQQAQQVLAEQQRQQLIDNMNRGLEAIKRLDPSIKSFQDLIDHESYDKIDELYTQGMKLEDAYKIANFDRLMQGKQAAARQQVMNQAAGKQHMKTTGQHGKGDDIHVPTETMEIYRAMMPGMTDAQIRESYKKHHK